MEKTFIILKPDAVKNRHIGDILARIDKEGFKIAALRMVHISRSQAEEFYAVHKSRPFYNDLCNYMSSGPSVVAVLEVAGAVAKWRELIGATDPAQAAPNTIRKLYAESKEANAVHGSDSVENAAVESAFFFRTSELVG